MTTVVNLRYDAYDIYIGRGSKWGNPYSHKDHTLAAYKVKTRTEAISKYEDYILHNQELLSSLFELEDKVLGCFCKKPHRNISCHGDILSALSNTRKMYKIDTIEALIVKYTEVYLCKQKIHELF